MDYYGTKLATCSSDRSVKIFNVRNDQQVLVADLHGFVLHGFCITLFHRTSLCPQHPSIDHQFCIEVPRRFTGTATNGLWQRKYK